MSRVLHPLGLGCHFSRVLMSDEVTASSLASMKERIGESAKLLLPNLQLDVLAYACTSASATIGEAEIFSQLAQRQVIVSTDLTSSEGCRPLFRRTHTKLPPSPLP